MKPTVFLSASIPLDPARGDYVLTADPMAIREAVRALAAIVLRAGGELVFGGHPAISPLVEETARTLNGRERVHIFQSEEFRGLIPEEAQRFENLRWTPKGADRVASLRIMRQDMIGFRDYTAGVFIGGMDGVEDEFEIFQQLHPQAQAFPVASTGGAAIKLWEAGRGTPDQPQRQRLRYDVTYRSLFRDLLDVGLAGA